MSSPHSSPLAFRYNRFAVWAALIAVLLRAAIPSGWMPDTNTSGTAIIICTAQGLSTIVLDKDGNPVEPGDEKNKEHGSAPCVFASTAHFSVPDFSTEKFVTRVEVDVQSFVQPRSPSALARPNLQQARAPPAIS
jgi:hypothetical protein